jgi:elongation factor Ts
MEAWPPRNQEPRFFCAGSVLLEFESKNYRIEEEWSRFMTTATEKISATQVKDLREKSGAPMGDCLKALQESKGDIEAAFVVLRKRGMASAAKKASRNTNEGAVGNYIHAGGKIGVMVELNCESDFVARTDDFQELLRDIAMHIAASDPRYVRPEDVTQEDLDREKEIYKAQAIASGKPENIAEKMVVGKMAKFYEEVCLLEQPFIKEQSISIKELIAQKVGKLGENITVRRFARFKVGDPNWTVATTKLVEGSAE